MSKDIDAIQFRNEDGDYVYAKTHLDAIDGMEGYTEGLTQITQLLGDYIFDTGWKMYDVHKDVTVNALYSNGGFHCGIRETTLNQFGFGNGIKNTTKMIRINVKNFTNGMQLFQLPTGFVNKTVRFSMAGNGYRLPYTIEILPDGKVTVFVHPSEQGNSSTSNWIYGQYTWIE
ncbi:hypothetical protein [Staphylococcus equorum]|uniref:hypothetical protein n=1 Tax=Staphylococcus equorum TaxID=246432 RepID=UPI000853B61A|nr:hypothetical protein [Staphylococcus equorum]OEK62781.1 hypothetical protein ASS99_07675 [Staphylococcus equorum]